LLVGNTLFGTTEEGGSQASGTVFAFTLPSSGPLPIPLEIQLVSETVVLKWSDPASVFSLQFSPTVNGVYITITGATSPYTNPLSGPAAFYRLKSN